MSKTVSPLTNTQVKNAKPREKEYNLSDGRGLALRVKPNGTKSWLFSFLRPYTKKRANISFGVYPDVTLGDARAKREETRKLITQDIDPTEHREENRRTQLEAHGNTFEHVASQWFEIKKTEVSANYADDIWRSLDRHMFPVIGKIPLHKLTAPKTIAALKPVAARGNLETIKRLCQRINEVMTYATNVGVIMHNPLAGISKAFKSPGKQNLPTLKPERLPEFMYALSIASIKRTTRCLIEWQLHTMVRPSEAAGAEWAEIDEEKALWHIPGERMKKKKAHTVPLSPQAIALLEVLRPISGHTKYLFISDRHPIRHANPSTANVAIKRMGFGGELVAHGLRALASTTLNEKEFDADVIESALAHVDKNDVRSAYNRAEYIERRREMMSWWSDHIEKAATGNMSMATSGAVEV